MKLNLSIFFILITFFINCTNSYSQQSFERTSTDWFYHNPLHASFISDSTLVVDRYGKSECGAKYISLLDEKSYPI